jgi:hypothetical protein
MAGTGGPRAFPNNAQPSSLPGSTIPIFPYNSGQSKSFRSGAFDQGLGSTNNHPVYKKPANVINRRLMTIGYITGSQTVDAASGASKAIRGFFTALWTVDGVGALVEEGMDLTLLDNTLDSSVVQGGISQDVTGILSDEAQIVVENSSSAGGDGTGLLAWALWTTTFDLQVGEAGQLGCFVAGTLVMTPLGPVAIEKLVKGDTVWAYSHDRGRVVESSVIDTHVHESKPIWALAVEGADTLRVTDNHPFWVPHRNDYVPVGALEPGMEVLTALGKTLVVVGANETQELATVFNVKVADQHNYFVGDQAVLVHNK